VIVEICLLVDRLDVSDLISDEWIRVFIVEGSLDPEDVVHVVDVMSGGPGLAAKVSDHYAQG
jgi:hypothetical protein